MKQSHPYLFAGVAAIALAVLYPAYWVQLLNSVFGGNFDEVLREDFMRLSFGDFVFALVGTLEIIVYLALAKMFRDQFGGDFLRVMLFILAGIVFLMHATVFIDVMIALGIYSDETAQNVIDWGLGISVMAVVLYGVVAMVCAIAMLTKFSQLTALLKAFSIMLLFVGLFSFLLITGFLNVLLMPIAMLLVGIQFFRNDQEVDVV